MTVWLVYKNGNFWGSQRVVAICLTQELASQYAAKNEDLEEKDRHLYGYHCIAMEVIDEQGKLEQEETDLRKLGPSPDLLF